MPGLDDPFHPTYDPLWVPWQAGRKEPRHVTTEAPKTCTTGLENNCESCSAKHQRFGGVMVVVTGRNEAGVSYRRGGLIGRVSWGADG